MFVDSFLDWFGATTGIIAGIGAGLGISMIIFIFIILASCFVLGKTAELFNYINMKVKGNGE